MPADDSDDDLRKDLEAAFDTHDARNTAPYDGVLGTLSHSDYDWIPDWQKNEFRRARNRLLDAGMAPTEIRTAMDEWRAFMRRSANDPTAFAYLSPLTLTHREAIDYLVLIETAIDAGKQCGQKMLGDSAGYKLTRSASEGGKQTNQGNAERNREMRAAMEDLRQRRPYMSKTERRRRIAERFACSTKTVQRNVG